MARSIAFVGAGLMGRGLVRSLFRSEAEDVARTGTKFSSATTYLERAAEVEAASMSN